MSNATVKIEIEQDNASEQVHVSLKIELEEQTKLTELLEYLREEGKLLIPAEKVVVYCEDTKVSENSNIGDNSKNNKIQLVIRTKNQLGSTSINIPITSEISQNKISPVAQQAVQPQPQQQSAQQRHVQRVEQPGQNVLPPSSNNESITLVLNMVDGDQAVTFSFPAKIVDSFEDVKPKIDQFVISNKMFDNWSIGQEIKIIYNGKLFKKGVVAFQKLSIVDSSNKIAFRLDRMYPGGGI